MTELKVDETVVPWSPDYLRDQMGVAKPVDQDDFPHNWMYSFSPGRTAGTSWKQEGQEVITEIGIWLVGFCKNCRHAFSAPIYITSTYQEQLIRVPKTGCVPYDPN